MPETSSFFTSPAPYHILLYGTLLGTEFFQTFIAGPVSYRALPRPMFSQLQQKLFPVYFILQTTLSPLILLTYPLLPPSHPISTLLTPSSPHFTTTTIPLSVIFLTSLFNLAYLGPLTTRTMKERKVQETRDGKKYDDDTKGARSKEMVRLNKRFARIHGASALVNLVGWMATGWYGARVLGGALVGAGNGGKY